MNSGSAETRRLLVEAMSGRNAHLDLASALDNFPPALRSAKPPAAPHTPWQLLEHICIAQWDILEFSKGEAHRSPKWPDEYWPSDEAPPDEQTWNRSVQQIKDNHEEMVRLVMDESNDLLSPFPHGDGQTLLREALLIANHNSYHLGQLVFLRKQLESAPPG